MKNVDKKNEGNYCLNSILEMKMKHRKKKIPYFVRVNVTREHVDKKSNRKYCFNSILQMKMKERKKGFSHWSRMNVAMKNVDKKMNENIVLTQYFTSR